MIDLLQPGAYARAAGGNLERPDIQAPVIRWMAWSINADNGEKGNPAVWGRCRSLWDAAGIQNFPWLHCRSMLDIERLIAVAEQYRSPAIGLNIEDVVSDRLPLAEVEKLVTYSWDKPVHMPTLGWVQNGQGWQHMAFAVVALELFPGEGPFPNGWDPVVAQQCIDHALAEGLTQITLMLGTKAPTTAHTYGSFFSICHSLYTADDIVPDAAAWQMWEFNGTCVSPVPPSNGGPVPTDPVPAGAYDDVARLQTTNIKRPDGKDATAFNDQAASLKASRMAVNDHEKRIAAIEKKLGL